MKRLLLALLTLSVFASAGANAEAKKLLITDATLTDTDAGCACTYTVKNQNTIPLKRFEAYVFIKNGQETFNCDAVHLSFQKPIQPNESRTLSNRANGKSCGASPSAELTMVMTCDYTDRSECLTEEVDASDTNLKWIK